MALKICRLGIGLLAIMLLLAGKSHAKSYAETTTTASPETSTTTTTTMASTTAAEDGENEQGSTTVSPFIAAFENEDQFEVIDVAEHATKNANGRILRQPAGETTRFYTTGDVDEKFWLTHLGEDFKHAIHLLVGGNEQYADIFNNTKPGGYVHEVHHEYLDNAGKPQKKENYYQSPYNYADKEQYPKNYDYVVPQPAYNESSTYGEQYEEHHEPQYSSGTQYGKDETSVAARHMPSGGSYEHQPYENVFKMDDHGISSNQYNNDNYYAAAPRSYSNYAASQQTSESYDTPNYSQKITKPTYTYTYDKQYTAKQRAGEEPVVVTLPEHSHNDGRPLVVSMPPVIYHSYPTGGENANTNAAADSYDEEAQHAEPQHTPSQYTQNQHTYNTQNQHTYSTQNQHTYNTQTHTYAHSQHPYTHEPVHTGSRQYATAGQVHKPTHTTIYATTAAQNSGVQATQNNIGDATDAATDGNAYNNYHPMSSFYNPPPFDLNAYANSALYRGGVTQGNAVPRHYRNIHGDAEIAIRNQYLDEPLVADGDESTSLKKYVRGTRNAQDIFVKGL